MPGFIEVLRFELRQQIRTPLLLIIAAIYAAIAYGIVSLSAAEDRVVLVTAPYGVMAVAQVIGGLLLMLPAAAFVGNAIVRDYETHTAELFFASGIGERAFLLGRFAACVIALALVGVVVVAAMVISAYVPWRNEDVVGAFSLTPYTYTLRVLIVPNAFILAALFFSAAALTRSIAAAYIAALVLFAGNYVTASLIPQTSIWYALADPFGGGALEQQVRLWTNAELNTELPGGMLYVNRLVWLAIAAAVLAATIWRFRFNPEPGSLRLWPRRRERAEPAPLPAAAIARPRFDGGGRIALLRSQFRLDLGAVVTSIPFYVMLGLTAVFVVLGVTSGNQPAYGTPLYPVTSSLTNTLIVVVPLLLLLIVFYLSGELVQRERTCRVDALIDASPAGNGVAVLSKLVVLWTVCAAVLLFAMLAVVIAQTVQGYTRYQLGVSFAQFFGVVGVGIMLIAAIGVFVQTLVPNKWLGLLALLVIYLVSSVAIELGFEHRLYQLYMPTTVYSDMNGFGHYAREHLATGAYLLAFTALFLFAAFLLYRRGTDAGIGARLRAARERLTPVTAALGGAALAAVAGTGAWVYYNTNVLNEYRVTGEIETLQAEYEKRYKQYENTNRLEYTDVALEVDLYPAERRLVARGEAEVINTEPDPVGEVLVNGRMGMAEIELSLARGELAEHAEDHSVFRFTFSPPLAPGERVRMNWRFVWENPGFPNTGANDSIVENGTFVSNNELIPSLGYDSNRELVSSSTRREHDLPPRERAPAIDDAAYHDIGLFGAGRRTGFRAIVGTSADQIAVAPGYLQREWLENGRRYFEYAMDEPIWPFFSISSARYDVAREDYNGVAIEIYYDPQHPYNVERMIESSKRSLDYFAREFSPYQYRQYRVLEFPLYRGFAQSFPNTIPYSEAMGFIADQRDPAEIDYPFVVTSHEMAHQWWGHQLLGAAVQGVNVLTETLAEYSSLMVTEHYYGEEMMRRFLRYELDRYLSSRSTELFEELPLMYSENQQYIHYQKGALVMYAIRDLIGEDRVNLALRNFLADFGYAEPPLPTTRDLLAALLAVAEPEHRGMIRDWFGKIVLYELAVESAAVAPDGDAYEVTIDLAARQLEADGQGAETEVPLSAWLDIGVFPHPEGRLGGNDLPPPLYLEKHLITSGEQQIVIRVDAEPDRVGIDPYHKLIDRNPDDNLLKL